MSMYEILMCELLKHLIRNDACQTPMIINGPHEWLEKEIILSCHHLSLYPTRNHFLSYGDRKKGRLYTRTGWTVAVPRNRSKTYPKAIFAPKNKAVVTVWSSDANHTHYNFLNSSKPLHLRSMLRKLMRYTQNAVPTAVLFFMLTPTWHTWHNVSKVEQIGLWCVNSSVSATNWQHISRHPKNTSTSNRMQKYFPKIHWLLKHEIYTTKINLFLAVKNIAYLAPILFNKEVFEF